ncbi:MAG TPA: DegV family protein [Anaerolineae bacterium]|nr:DegV family protein [Anaerolineae bacterium]
MPVLWPPPRPGRVHPAGPSQIPDGTTGADPTAGCSPQGGSGGCVAGAATTMVGTGGSPSSGAGPGPGGTGPTGARDVDGGRHLRRGSAGRAHHLHPGHLHRARHPHPHPAPLIGEQENEEKDMATVGILTDTSASIPAPLVKELGIELVPYYIHRGLETLRDLIDVEPEAFARYLKTATKLPTTSNPSPGDYLAGLQRLAERTREIVVLTMTSKGSGAYQSCRAAVDILRERMPKIRVEVVDTLQVAMSQGWAAIEAARAALTGLSLKEVMEGAVEVARQGMMIQTADTLRYLHMGGRIGRAQHLVGSLLNIKPLIGMEDGVIVALGTARSRAKAYARMVELMRQRVGEGARIKVAFTHVAALEQLEQLRRRVLAHFDCAEVLISPLSPVLAVHSGPGTVGLSFFAV